MLTYAPIRSMEDFFATEDLLVLFLSHFSCTDAHVAQVCWSYNRAWRIASRDMRCLHRVTLAGIRDTPLGRRLRRRCPMMLCMTKMRGAHEEGRAEQNRYIIHSGLEAIIVNTQMHILQSFFLLGATMGPVAADYRYFFYQSIHSLYRVDHASYKNARSSERSEQVERTERSKRSERSERDVSMIALMPSTGIYENGMCHISLRRQNRGCYGPVLSHATKRMYCVSYPLSESSCDTHAENEEDENNQGDSYTHSSEERACRGDEIVAYDIDTLDICARFGSSYLGNAHGLEVHENELFACDTDHDRIVVFAEHNGECLRMIHGSWSHPISIHVIHERLYLTTAASSVLHMLCPVSGDEMDAYVIHMPCSTSICQWEDKQLMTVCSPVKFVQYRVRC